MGVAATDKVADGCMVVEVTEYMISGFRSFNGQLATDPRGGQLAAAQEARQRGSVASQNRTTSEWWSTVEMRHVWDSSACTHTSEKYK